MLRVNHIRMYWADFIDIYERIALAKRGAFYPRPQLPKDSIEVLDLVVWQRQDLSLAKIRFQISNLAEAVLFLGIPLPSTLGADRLHLKTQPRLARDLKWSRPPIHRPFTIAHS